MAARLVSDTRKFDRSLRQLMYVNFHWLDVPARLKFKLMSVVHNCLHHMALWYLTDYCIPIFDVASRHLCSAGRHYLVVHRHSLSSYGHRAFAVPGPTAWNSRSDDLNDHMLLEYSCLLCMANWTSTLITVNIACLIKRQGP